MQPNEKKINIQDLYAWKSNDFKLHNSSLPGCGIDTNVANRCKKVFNLPMNDDAMSGSGSQNPHISRRNINNIY